MTEIDFYKLSRVLQDALLEAFRGQFTPAPILARPGARSTVLAWVVVSYTAALGLGTLCVAGFGDVEKTLALHPTPIIAAYVLLAVASALGVIQAIARRSSLKALPFQPGVFLFPASVIDARDHKLRVYPLAELTSVSTGSRGAVVVRFGRRSFSFPVADAARTLEIAGLVEAARDRMRANPDAAERRRLDPLEPPSVESPFAPSVPLSRLPSRLERHGWILAVALGAAVGVGLFFLRNRLSDDRMFALAQTRDDVASYKSYVARGRRHAEVVSHVLLPRAELRLAAAQGSVEAVDAFMQAYPGSGIQEEVDAARQTALTAEFERTRKAGTLAALLSFAERYPKHGVDKAFAEAKHAIYARALARYKSEMPKGGEAHAEFVGRLVAYAERMGTKSTPQGLRGPAAQLRFRRLPSEDLERSEGMVRKSPMFGGVTSLPTHYLTAAGFEPHEQSSAQALADGLARGFDPEILTFEPGPPIDGAVKDPVPVTTPTLVVSYRVESSGAAQAKTKPRGIFLGLIFYFKADFLLPADPKPLSEKQRLMQSIPADILNQQTGAPPPGAVETAVYQAMMRGAFVEFRDRYLGKWFRPRPSAPSAPSAH